MLLLAVMAVLVVPATADVTNTATAGFTTAPTSVEQGADLGDVVVDVGGVIEVDIADLPRTDALETPSATLALLDGEGNVVSGALVTGENGSNPVDVDSGTAKFTDLTLATDVVVGAGYELEITARLEGFFETRATSDLEVTAPNTQPVAAFSTACDGLLCTFTDASTDDDGDADIVGWAWDFGDGESTSIDQSPQFTYDSPGEYTVKLTVEDDAGATSTTSKKIAVFDESQDCTDGCTFEIETPDTVDYTIVGPASSGASAGVNVDAVNPFFGEECRDLETENPDLRILPTTIQVVPSGFAEGEFFTVTVIIPKDVINEDVNRSDKPWTVCFWDEKDPDDTDDPFKGRVRLLERCEQTDDPACLVSLEKFRGANLEMVFEFPAVDPYFR